MGFFILVLYMPIAMGMGAVVGQLWRRRPGAGAALGPVLCLLWPFGLLAIGLLEDARRKCPACRSLVEDRATVCARCGREIQSQWLRQHLAAPPRQTSPVHLERWPGN